MSAIGHHGESPRWTTERGYGLGDVGGILVLTYSASHHLDLGEDRQDMLHQLYWCPDGMLGIRHDGEATFLGPDRAFWVERSLRHRVLAGPGATVHRLCLREVPPGLEGVRRGLVDLPAGAASIITTLSGGGVEEGAALGLRAALLDELRPTARASEVRPAGRSQGLARQIADALLQHPADPRTLEEWATLLHVSSRTLQRDFGREFGSTFARWRNDLRLQAAEVLLPHSPVASVSREVGFSTASAFVQSFRRSRGRTPGSLRAT